MIKNQKSHTTILKINFSDCRIYIYIYNSRKNFQRSSSQIIHVICAIQQFVSLEKPKLRSSDEVPFLHIYLRQVPTVQLPESQRCVYYTFQKNKNLTNTYNLRTLHAVEEWDTVNYSFVCNMMPIIALSNR